MTEALRKWLAKNKPPESRSKMAKYKNEIAELWEQNFTLIQIQDFLAEQNIAASRGEIWNYIQRINKASDRKRNGNGELKSGTKPEGKQAAPSSEPVKITPPKKFEWDPNKKIEI